MPTSFQPMTPDILGEQQGRAEDMGEIREIPGRMDKVKGAEVVYKLMDMVGYSQ